MTYPPLALVTDCSRLSDRSSSGQFLISPVDREQHFIVRQVSDRQLSNRRIITCLAQVRCQVHLSAKSPKQAGEPQRVSSLLINACNQLTSETNCDSPLTPTWTQNSE